MKITKLPLAALCGITTTTTLLLVTSARAQQRQPAYTPRPAAQASAPFQTDEA